MAKPLVTAKTENTSAGEQHVTDRLQSSEIDGYT